MADPSTCPPLTRESVIAARKLIANYIHLTPVHTSKTLDGFASVPQTAEDLMGTEWEGQEPANPQIRLFFKCENYQKIGAFKARGAFHALCRLTPEQRAPGIITHSSGNHAQATALAARTFSIKAHVIMPAISTPSKIAGTRSLGANIVFSGSTSEEREAKLAEVQELAPGALILPPYDHPDVILGQGTASLEFEEQVKDLSHDLDAMIAPLGGGGLLAGTATAMSGTGIRVFGAEPRYEGANDGERGLKAGKRVEEVSTMTIADGLRTPVGVINWSVISDPEKLRGIFSVTEDQIKKAMRLVLERMKIFAEPSACVPLAVVLYNEDFRRLVESEQNGKTWNVGIILSGGNTTVDAIATLYAPPVEIAERPANKGSMNGERNAVNVTG